MRSRFEHQLSELNRELTELGAMCEEIIAHAAKALVDGETRLLPKIGALDVEIGRREREIESLCLKLFLQQQPVAGDLRQISAALKMVTDMERIGDQASDIGEIIPFLRGRTGSECVYIRAMAEAAIRMVTESVDAFVKRDTGIARAAIAHDDVVDDYFMKVKASLIRMTAGTPGEGEYALDLLMIAKYFERIGDHAVNIAEWVVFSVTGEHD